MMYLDPPETLTATRDPDAREILRVAIADGEAHVSMMINEDPEAWGRLLADVVGHIANSLRLRGHDMAETERRIVGALVERMEASADGDDSGMEGRIRRD